MYRYYVVTTLLFLSTLLAAQEKRGEISGQIIDGNTHQPLIGANVVVVEKPTIGAITNVDGNFFIKSLEVGEYSLRMTLIGYETSVLTNVVVSTGRSAKVKVKMEETSVEIGEVEVRADYFSRAGSISPVSTIGLNGAEVARSPGSIQDMNRLMLSLPNVGNSNDQSNELIVRGGAPHENLTVMDYVEIPSTNHYPNEFNSGGPINMVNVDLIEDVRFSTGGFPAQYGDKLSSVMDVTLREGDRRRSFASNTGFNFAGFSTVMEGGIDNGRGSWILSARRSLLETLDNVTGISALGLTAIPKYYDTQFKVAYDLSPTQKFMASGIYGDDKILIKGDPKEKNEQKAGITDSSSVQNVDVHTNQYAIGASLKSLWGTEGFSVFTVYSFGNKYNVKVSDDFTRRSYDKAGKVTNHTLLNSQGVFDENTYESVLSARYDVVYRLFQNHELSAGVQYQTTWKFEGRSTYESDSLRYDLNGDGIFETYPPRFPAGDVQTHLGLGDAYKLSGYVSDKFSIVPRVTLTAGLRYDYFSYSKHGSIGPRTSISLELVPELTRLNFAYGEFYQVQPLPYYSDNRNIGYNHGIQNAHARHFVLGVEQVLDEGLKGSIEVYDKQYSDLAVSDQFIHSLADPTFRSDRVFTVFDRHSRGIEFFLQQKQVKDFFGTISYSYSSTTSHDPRIGREGKTFLSEYDYPHILTVVLGKIVKGTRTWLNESLLKYPAMVLPFSDDMEISLRFRYSSGKPYMPAKFVTDRQEWIGNVAWSKGAWVNGSVDVNTARYPEYHRLDVQWISRYHMTGWNIVTFIAIQNLYNRDNIASYMYASDGTIQTIHQFAFFPVGGVSVEF
jgi:hypothetical protein